jgi:hypothetical protein
MVDEFRQPEPIRAPGIDIPLESRTPIGDAINEPDRETRALLRAILFELRKMNLALATGLQVEVSDSDVEV